MSPVKGHKVAKAGPLGDRLATLLELFSPWDGISLTYRQLAAELGPPVTEAAVKKWPQRKRVPSDVARLIVAKARGRGLRGVTLEWVLWGEGPGPTRSGAPVSDTPMPVPAPAPQGRPSQFATAIAEALQDDLSHNEFGQWSSVEVQHTVTWALKDLARRLRALQFDMGKTFELTDVWARRIGLPVRPPERADEGDTTA
jgi:hypothetical protein